MSGDLEDRMISRAWSLWTLCRRSGLDRPGLISTPVAPSDEFRTIGEIDTKARDFIYLTGALSQACRVKRQ